MRRRRPRTCRPIRPGPIASRLPVGRATADFTLPPQTDDPSRSKDLRGKVVRVSSVLTTRGGSCPATTHRLSRVGQALGGTGMLKDDRVRRLPITLDPARDTPEPLRKCMTAYDADPARWTFLSGPVGQVGKVRAAWGTWAEPASNGRLDHPSRAFLADGRGIYNLDFFKPAWVLGDVPLLLEEVARGPDKGGNGEGPALDSPTGRSSAADQPG
ncbi:MAG TPA: SCO family protein [Gemmataceae bacterium]|nr:SCO family protein [Gemmataceae bacterium]